MKRYVYITLALLALMAGQAHAQRCLPGMKGVRLTVEMADGFYCGANRHDAGYAFSLAVSTYTKKRKPVGVRRGDAPAQHPIQEHAYPDGAIHGRGRLLPYVLFLAGQGAVPEPRCLDPAGV